MAEAVLQVDFREQRIAESVEPVQLLTVVFCLFSFKLYSHSL